LRKEHRLRVFAKKVLRKKRDKVTVGWRRLHNEELHVLYCSPCVIRMIKSSRIRWEGHVARTGDSG
jgi:hypothetical protein